MILNQSSCESDNSDDSEYYSVDSDMENNDENLVADASYTEGSVRFNRRLHIDDIQEINKGLDLYEKVSLVYLLYNSPHIALQQIILLLQNVELKVLEEWYHSEKKNNKWESKLLECLTIIQNYKILKVLGFEKKDLNVTYMPLQDVSLNVNLVRKYCYRVCEDFNTDKTERFLKKIEDDFREKGMQYIPDKKYDTMYLEMYFLFFEIERYISLDNILNLAKIFKSINELNLHDKFENLHDQIKRNPMSNYNIDKTPGHAESTSIPSEIDDCSKVEEGGAEEMSDIYDIDPTCPGTLLLINNESFYTEYREQFETLLPKTDLKLENRSGTVSDKISLKETFERFGFKIILKDNLIHEDMLIEIKNTVKNFEHSSLFVAILSHGDKDIVYGANSVAVQVNEIQGMMCGRELSGKPKVLLLQSCQGTACQKVEDDNYKLDGPCRTYRLPKTTDLLTFRATISGYGAVRHVVEGSWFIQAFCKVIKENPEYHIHEICTKVNAEVSKKKWGNKCMVPIFESTFTKRLYLKIVK